MKEYCITFRSITYAQNGQRVLNRAQIPSRLTRTPRWMEERGCGYCLRLNAAHAPTAMETLRSGGAQYRAVYAMQPDGSAAEVVM